MYKLTDNTKILDHSIVGEKVYFIKDLEEEKRPRERLVKYGPSILSSQELLAIVLGVGTKKEEVMVMANRILKEYGEKTIAYETDPIKLGKSLGIPDTKACQIVATFELGRRYFARGRGRRAIVRTPKQAYGILKDMGGLNKEHLRGLYLNSRYEVVHDEVISVGTLTAGIIHPREVFKPALEYSAAAVIIAHNHPSGSLKPTTDDIEITKKLIQAGDILGIKLVDHLIIAESGYACVLA